MSDTALTLPNIPRDLLSPVGLPPGFETCWAFLARTEPATLALMLDPVAGLAGDDLLARETAKKMRQPMVLFPAHEVLREAGLQEIGAYPEAVMERVFPANP